MAAQRRVLVWLRATRPFSLAASVVPVLVGTALAADLAFDPALFALALLGAIVIQIGTNLANEYFDYMQGLDSDTSLGPVGVILQGLLSPRAVLAATLGAFAIGAGMGLAIVWVVGWPILVIGVASLLAAYFYAAKPLALGYRGLGEVEVFVFMGPLMVVAAYYVQGRQWDWAPLWVSLSIGFLVTAILHANHTRDIDDDRGKGRVTHAILLGRRRASHEFLLLVSAGYLALVGVAAVGLVSPLALLAVLSLPKAAGLVRLVYIEMNPRALNALVRGTAQLHGQFGLLLALGLALVGWLD
ncbi:MAG: 1,4-dihydroxy-2-naphthoate octaprenyltransferase [Dehalococcoidia bacterium]